MIKKLKDPGPTTDMGNLTDQYRMKLISWKKGVGRRAYERGEQDHPKPQRNIRLKT